MSINKTPVPSDAELTRIYKIANGEDKGKPQPITSQRIFRAMRAAINEYSKQTKESV